MATQTIRIAMPLSAGSYTADVQVDGSNTDSFSSLTLTQESNSLFWTFGVTAATEGMYAYQVKSGSAIVGYGWFYSDADVAVTIQDSDTRDGALQGSPVNGTIAYDIAAISGGSGGGLTGADLVEITVTDGVNPVPGAIVKAKAGAAFDIKRTDANGLASFSLDDNTYSVRITADRLSFTPVNLVVTGDVAVSYAMTEVIVDETSWATGSDMVSYHDAAVLGQMLKDDRTVVALVDVPDHPIIGRMLSLGTGEVNAALTVANRYTSEQLAAMPDSSLEYLRWLTCAIAMWHMRQRRINSDPERQARDRKNIDDNLDRLRRGELVFDVDVAKAAGIESAVPFTQADLQRGTPLLRDHMSGIAGAFPKRRFPRRN